MRDEDIDGDSDFHGGEPAPVGEENGPVVSDGAEFACE